MLIPLLRTKLQRPTLRPSLVPRERLSVRLTGSSTTRLALVVAPAGFGKTTLVAEWLQSASVTSDSRATAWVSLDALDNDPSRLMAHVIAALQQVEPAWGEAALALLHSAQLPPAELIVTTLINDLVAQPTPVVLVLDDYHLIRAEWIHNALAFLLDNCPAALRLLLIAREDPPLPLSRLRVRGQLVEIRADDLRFTLEEALAFVNQTMGLELSVQAVAKLEERTEGWIAGLQLAALALQEHENAEGFVNAFSGSQRYVIDYLVDEVLRLQSPEVRAFLVQTSVLERFCAPLCEAVMTPDSGIESPPDARAMISYLDRANLFLTPLDNERRWYRYHHLFADSLRAELLPAEQAVLHRRAAGWLRTNGLLPEAIQHALAAHDDTLAADLLSQAGRDGSIWQSADYHRYLLWVEQLPPKAIAGRLELQLCYSRALYLYGRLAEAEAMLDAVDAHLASLADPPWALLAIAAAYRAQCALEHGNYSETQRLAEYALAHLPSQAEQDWARVCYALGSAYYAQGRATVAGGWFQQGGEVALRQGALSLALSSFDCAARCLLLQGRLRDAHQLAEQTLELGQLGSSRHPLIVGALLTLGEVAYQQNDLAAVEPLLQQAIMLAEPMGALVRAQQCWAYQQLARLRLAQSKAAWASEASLQAEAVAREVNNAFYLQASEMRQRIRSQEPHHDAMPMRVYMPSQYYALEQTARWMEACRHLALRQPQEALARWETLLGEAREAGRYFEAIELHLWRARAWQALCRQDDALLELEQALDLAVPETCVRPFLDLGLSLGELLRQGATERAFAPLLQALDQVPGSASRPPGAPAASLGAGQGSAALVEPLSERELEVLRLVAAGLSNKEIGDRLYIGVGTVKWYATIIYSKLGVSSRTQAASRARELGLFA